jgi:hypothetical protein
LVLKAVFFPSLLKLLYLECIFYSSSLLIPFKRKEKGKEGRKEGRKEMQSRIFSGPVLI